MSENIEGTEAKPDYKLILIYPFLLVSMVVSDKIGQSFGLYLFISLFAVYIAIMSWDMKTQMKQVRRKDERNE